MQSVTIYQNTSEGMVPVGPSLGPESARLANLKASFELEQKNLLKTMMDNAVRHKEQGNMAMEQGQHRHAVSEYNNALYHTRSMMEHLEVEEKTPLNGYQLRALARGQPLPKRGIEGLNPFRALVHSNRGLAFIRLDAYDRAIEDLEKACQLEPKYLKAWVRRSTALAANNQIGLALDVLDEALLKACPDEFAKEQVCKLIVNLRSLGKVEVSPPQDDLPIVYKDEPKTKKTKMPREKVRVSLFPQGSVPEGSPVFVEVDKRDLNAFIKEDWNPTHVGGRWRQTRDEINIVVPLPRKPKSSELRVQIRPERVWVLLRKKDLTAEQVEQDDFDTLLNHKLCRLVKPSESCWTMEGSESPEIHFSLQKHSTLIGSEYDDVTPHLWDRAFEDDSPIDTSMIALAKAEKARLSRRETMQNAKKVEFEGQQKSLGQHDDEVLEHERFAAQTREQMGL